MITSSRSAPHGGHEAQPALGQRRAVQQHLVEVQNAAALGDDAIGQRLRGRVGQARVGYVGHRGVRS